MSETEKSRLLKSVEGVVRSRQLNCFDICCSSERFDAGMTTSVLSVQSIMAIVSLGL